jgi:hypothetical protein
MNIIIITPLQSLFSSLGIRLHIVLDHIRLPLVEQLDLPLKAKRRLA